MEILKYLGIISTDTLDAFHITVFTIFLAIVGLYLYVAHLMKLQDQTDDATAAIAEKKSKAKNVFNSDDKPVPPRPNMAKIPSYTPEELS